MPRETRSVTETEFAILNVLWDRGPTTVREIVETIYRKHAHSLHASVKSLLERLADKDFVQPVPVEHDQPSARDVRAADADVLARRIGRAARSA